MENDNVRYIDTELEKCVTNKCEQLYSLLNKVSSIKGNDVIDVAGKVILDSCLAGIEKFCKEHDYEL